jgi:hypothetical protein
MSPNQHLEMTPLVKSLTAEQADTLQKKGLKFSELTEEQQGMFRAMLIDTFFDLPHDYPAQFLTGEGARMAWVLDGKTQKPSNISFDAPQVANDRVFVASFAKWYFDERRNGPQRARSELLKRR